jgi:hypothetical protein
MRTSKAFLIGSALSGVFLGASSGAQASVLASQTARCTGSGLLGASAVLGGRGPECFTPVVTCADRCTFAGSITVTTGAHIGPVGGDLDANPTNSTNNAAVTSCGSNGPSCTGTYGGGAGYVPGSYRGDCFWAPGLVGLFVTVNCTITAETVT